MSWEATSRAEAASTLDEFLRIRTGGRSAWSHSSWSCSWIWSQTSGLRDAPEDAWLLPTETWGVKGAVQGQMNRDVCCPGIEEENPSWKWLSTRKMAPGGARRWMGLNLRCSGEKTSGDVWRNQMSGCSRNCLVVRAGKILGLCHWHYFCHFSRLHQLFLKKETSSQVFPWGPAPVDSSPLQCQTTPSELASQHPLYHKGVSGRDVPLSAVPSSSSSWQYVVLNKFCIT